MDFKEILQFLEDLRKNNNRDWFLVNKSRYQHAQEQFRLFIDLVIAELNRFDKDIGPQTAKDCVFRINRDVRFSNNKEPYKNNFGAFIAKGGRKSKYAGYYIHVEPEASFLGGGIYMPESPVLQTIRNHIYENPDEFKQILSNPSFHKYFKEIYGEKLTGTPKGFPKEFEDIGLLKYKHYAVGYSVENAFWYSENLLEKVKYVFRSQYPFNTFLNIALE